MMRLLPLIGAATVIVSLAACNSMSKGECRVADWRVIGDTDGAAGYNPQSRFADHVKSCARISVSPDQTIWYEGFQSGIRRFCTPLGGAAAGEAAKPYNNACPPELEGEFMRGYVVGKRVGDLRYRVSSLESGIRAKDYEINRKYDEMKQEKDERRRREIRNQIDDLDRDTRRMRREVDDVKYELQDAQRDLDYFRQTVSPTPAAAPAAMPISPIPRGR